MVTAQCLTDSQMCQVVLAPNNSHSWLQTVVFLSSIGSILLAISVFFALQGLWMVLPFAGVEFLALGLAMILVSRTSARRQVISIDRDRIRVEKGTCLHRFIADHGPKDCFEYPRSWVRLTCVPPSHDWHPSRLMLGASGRNVEIGEFLTEEERQELATQLKQWL